MSLKNIKNYNCFHIIALVLVVTVSGTLGFPGGGSGTESDPYLITTTEELDSIRNEPDAFYQLQNNLDFTGSVYDSANSAENKGWVPIDNFSGSFNGMGNNIASLYIDRTNEITIGLFAALDSGKVYDLKLTKCKIRGRASVGGVAGTNTGEITGCSVSGTVFGEIRFIGGISGWNYDTISYCTSSVTIDVSADNSGGIAGDNDGIITGSLFSGSLKNTDYSTGGIAGSNSDESQIIECSSSGYIMSSDHRLGGIAGLNNNLISECFSTAEIEGQNTSTGGITGLNQGIVSKCFYSDNTITATLGGGIAGTNLDTISQCYFSGRIQGNEVAGIAQQNGLSGNTGVIKDCYSTGLTEQKDRTFNGISAHNDSFIINCYSLNTRLASNHSTEVYNSFYDTLSLSKPLSSAGTPKTLPNLKLLSTFTDTSTQGLSYAWDFTGTPNHDTGDSDIWTIQEGNSFPGLNSIDNRPVAVNIFDTTQQNSSITIPLGITDADGDGIVSYTAVSQPDHGTLTFIDSSVEYTPDAGYCGFDSFEFKGSDVNGKSSNPAAVYLTITPLLSGDGSPENPYQITNADDLNSIRVFPDKSFIIVNNMDIEGSLYDSTNSPENKGWEPIGNPKTNRPFTGSLNGCGHEIRNLYILRPETDTVGLFMYTDSASIESLSIIDCNITGNNKVGALTGEAKNSEISFIYSSGEVEGKSENTGGITGRSYYGSLSYSHSFCNVTGKESTGGLIGKTIDSDINMCFYTGCVKGENFAGGIVGYNYRASLYNSYSTGNISGENTVGGFVGYNNSSGIHKCYSTGIASGKAYTGGFTGAKYAGFIADCFWDIENSFLDSTSDDATPKTRMDMKLVQTYTDTLTQGLSSPWDFKDNPYCDTSDSQIWLKESVSYPGLSFINNRPIAENIFYALDTGTQKEIRLHAADAEGDSISGYTLLSQPGHGSVSKSGDTVTYTPDNGYIGMDSFTYQAQDINGIKSNTAEVVFKIKNSFHGGDGSIENPYRISTVDELNEIRFLPDYHYELIDDLDFSGTQYAESEGWEPICSDTLLDSAGFQGNVFSGSLNGNGYEIANLFINRSDQSYTGLFGNISEYGTIKNMKLTGADVTGGNCSGIIAGYNSGHIIKCISQGSVSGDTSSGVFAGHNSGRIEICYSEGSVSGTRFTGGFTGRSSNDSILNSYSHADVAGSGNYAGGFIGYNEDTDVKNCFSTGAVSGNDTTGGFTGFTGSGSTNSCFYDENTSGMSSSSGGSGKSTDDMQKTSTFTNTSTGGLSSPWDFIDDPYDDTYSQDIWCMYQDSTYPEFMYLRNLFVKLQYTSSGNGTISGDTLQFIPIGGHGTQVSAEPETGYHFTEWSDSDTLNPRTDSSITQDLLITADFEINQYRIIITSSGNGTTEPLDTTYAEHGDTLMIEAIPDENHQFSLWSVTNNLTIQDSVSDSTSLNNITDSGTAVAHFELNTYTVSLENGSNGDISPSGDTVMQHGSDLSITALPETGYHFYGWETTNGLTLSDPDTSYTVITGITGPGSVTPLFAIDTFSLSYSAGEDGSLSGDTLQRVTYNSDGSYVTAIPDPGHHFLEWSDGNTDRMRRDSRVIHDTAVTALFAPDTFSVTYYAPGYGSISGEAIQSVVYGSNTSLVEAVPDTGYHFFEWSDGKKEAARRDSGITQNQTFSAEFAPDSFNLSYSAGVGGSITGDTIQRIRYMEDGTSVSATSEQGYHFMEWSDGKKEETRRDSEITQDLDLTAEFAPDTLTLSYSAGSYGSVTGDTLQEIVYGSEGSEVEAVPDTGYHFVEWSDGNTDNPRKETEAESDLQVHAVFSIDTLTLYYSADTGGSISGDTLQEVIYGYSGMQVEAEPDKGYEFDEWSDGNTDNPRIDTRVSQDIEVTALFSSTINIEYQGKDRVSLNPKTIKVAPNPVSLDQKLHIVFDAGEDISSVQIRIYDCTGNLVDKQQGYLRLSKTNIFTWDLRKLNGDKVGPGSYIVVALIKTSKGEKRKIKLTFGVRD